MTSTENVVARLKARLSAARSLGFKVRMELLDDEQASWCEIGGVPTLFVDLSQTAAEQLKQVEETLASYAQGREMAPQPGNPPAVASLPSDSPKRAA